MATGGLNVHDIIVECVTTLNLTLNTLYGKTCWLVGDIAQQFLGIIIFLNLINIWHSSVETQGYSLLCEILHWCPFIDRLEFHMVMNVTTSWWVIFCTLFFGGSELSVKRRSRSSGRRRCLRQWHYNTGFFGLGSYLAYITWARAVVEYALFRMTHSEKKNENTRNPPASRGGTMWRFFPNTISHKWRKDCC